MNSTAMVQSLLVAGGRCSRGCTTSQQFHWWGKRIDDEACAVLSQHLSGARPPALKNLLLGSNPLGDACVHAIASAARGGALAELRSLGLSRTRITDSGCETLAGSLRHLAHLRELYMSRLGVSDRCAQALAASLSAARAPPLVRLSLNDNALSSRAVQELLRVLTLRELLLNNNTICSWRSEMREALRQAPLGSLSVRHRRCSPVTPDEWTEAVSTLKAERPALRMTIAH